MQKTDFNPALLTLVREQAGLSQAGLAKIPGLGLRQAIISKYESGAIVPPAETVEKLASYFGYTTFFFSRPCELQTNGLIFHRKRSALAARERGVIEAEARLRAMDALHCGKKVGLSSDVLKREGRSPREMAIALRKHWKVPSGPLEGVFELLEQHGIVIIEFDFKTDLLDGFFLSMTSDVICLAVNSNEAFPPDRRRFSVLHELGHALLAEEMFPGREAEDEANAFAAEFLAPEADIKEELQSKTLTLQKLCTLKSRWGMSIAALLRRARDVGEFSDMQYRRACIFMNSKGLRKEEPPCGLKAEKATLFSSLLRQPDTQPSDLWTELGLLKATFNARYGVVPETRNEKKKQCR